MRHLKRLCGGSLAAFALCLGPAQAAPEHRTSGLVPAKAPEAVGIDARRLAMLNNSVQAAVDDGRFSGFVTLLARHGKIVAYDAYGKSDVEAGRPLAKDAIFRIYSMTKPITGVAMMILFEQDKWRLDDPVTKYVPEFSQLKVLKGIDADGRPVLEDPIRPPTMRELMSHTAGFGYGLSAASPVDRLYIEQRVLGASGLKQMIDRTAKIPLKFQPGTDWAYSSAVDIQGYIVEKLSGMSFGRFLSEHIFKPLRMVDTGFQLSPAQAARLARLYRAGPQGQLLPVTDALGYPLPDPTKPPANESGGGGLYSTAADYARFCQMLLNGGTLDGARILAPATVALINTNVVPDAIVDNPRPGRVANLRPGVGFGLDVLVETEPRRIGSLLGKGTMSWGGLAGTFFWVDPENELLFVGMTQRILDPTGSAMSASARTLVYQALVDPEK